MQLRCPVCRSTNTADFFVVTAAGLPPECLDGGTFKNVAADRNIVQALYGSQFDSPMIVTRFSFPPRPRFTSFWSIVCLIYGVAAGIVDLSLLPLAIGEVDYLPGMIMLLITGSLIGLIPFLRRKAWDAKWADRHRYLTRVASCCRCKHAWRP